MKADLVISNIGQLVTCASGRKPEAWAAHDVDVGLSRMAALLLSRERSPRSAHRTRSPQQLFLPTQSIDAGGKVVCPGFVDPHTHIVWAGDRLDEFELKIKGADYLEILAAGGGILSTVSKTLERRRFDELVETGLRRLDKMLACGTTTVEIKTGYGLDTDTELKDAPRHRGTRQSASHRHCANISCCARCAIVNSRDDADGYVALICDEMLPRAWDWYETSHFFDRRPVLC